MNLRVQIQMVDCSQATALVGVRVELGNSGATIAEVSVKTEVFEVGFDGGQPDSPVAVTEIVKIKISASEITMTDSRLSIGTPFFSTKSVPQPYAAVTTLEFASGQVDSSETRFILLAPESGGGLLICRETTRVPPRVSRINPQLPLLFIVSDSTAFSNGQNQLGWGDRLARFFDAGKINVLNRARPGRSARSFRSEGLWRRLLAEMKAGDFVLIQFGHNDADKLAEGRCRGVLPGVHEQTQEVVMPEGTCEIVRTYGWYLRQFIAEAKAKGATPVLLSLTVKNVWENGRLLRNQSQYGHWAAQVAQASGVDFIDLNQMIAERYHALGQEKVQLLFCSASDNVHTSPAGAELNAACVVDGLKRLSGRPLELCFRTE